MSVDTGIRISIPSNAKTVANRPLYFMSTPYLDFTVPLLVRP